MKVVVVILTLLILIGCGEQNSGKKVSESGKSGTSNSSSTSEYTFQKKIEIDGNNLNSPSIKDESLKDITYFSTDSRDNIFVVDNQKRIVKFNPNGEMLSTFGTIGTGPGEYSTIEGFVIVNDTIIITDPNRNLALKYDTNGNYLSNIKLKQRAPEFLKPLSNNRFLAFHLEVANEDDGTFIIGQTAIFNTSFVKLKVLSQYRVPYDRTNPQIDPSDFVAPFCSSRDGKIYVGVISENSYKIEQFNVDGDPISTISKPYRKMKLNREEQKDLADTFQSNEIDGKENVLPVAYKKAINTIFVDKNNCLWVNRAREFPEGYSGDDLQFNLFEDDKFKRTIPFPHLKIVPSFNLTHRVGFYGENIYVRESDEESGTLKLVNYNY